MKTLIVNAFGGPGVGKTTCCWHIASELKKRGILTEYVSEYAKELVYEEKFDLLDDSMYGQTIIFHEQKRRLDRLIGKVEIIVTDSPLLLSITYANDANEQFKNKILMEFNNYNNFNLVVLRNKSLEFEQSGRKENLEQSIIKDQQICELLEENNIFYGSYLHTKMDLIINNILTTYEKLK